MISAEKEPASGYKQRELGEIPEQWDAVKMGEIAKIQRGASPRPWRTPSRP